MATGLEAQVMRKVAWRLVPLLSLCYTINILDRFNVSVAALTMNKALGLTATTYGLGAGAFFWSYTLFQMPANSMLTRVGARRAGSPMIVVLWGLCSMGDGVIDRASTALWSPVSCLASPKRGFSPASRIS